MIGLWFLVLVLSGLHLSHSQTSSCRTNCATDQQCWSDTLIYHSSQLVDRLFSFTSLAVHVRKFQHQHSDEMNDNIVFINEALSRYLSNETTNANLPLSLFQQANQTLIELSSNLTKDAVEAVDELPSLICLSKTCTSDLTNYMVILIVCVLFSSLVFLLCLGRSYETFRIQKRARTKVRSVSFVHSSSGDIANLNIDTHQF